jgi:hypothetical protein
MVSHGSVGVAVAHCVPRVAPFWKLSFSSDRASSIAYRTSPFSSLIKLHLRHCQRLQSPNHLGTCMGPHP